MRAQVAVRALDCLAHLQFCRMRLSAYSALLQSVLTAAASSPMARTPCCQVLWDCHTQSLQAFIEGLGRHLARALLLHITDASACADSFQHAVQPAGYAMLHTKGTLQDMASPGGSAAHVCPPQCSCPLEVCCPDRAPYSARRCCRRAWAC